MGAQGGVRESSREEIPCGVLQALVGVCQAEKMGIGGMVYVEVPVEVWTWRYDIICILRSSESFRSQLIRCVEANI